MTDHDLRNSPRSYDPYNPIDPLGPSGDPGIDRAPGNSWALAGSLVAIVVAVMVLASMFGGEPTSDQVARAPGVTTTQPAPAPAPDPTSTGSVPRREAPQP